MNIQELYEKTKAQNTNVVILFRIGDFWEAFYDDAKIVARDLGLTLTTRSKRGETPIPMAGFPYHYEDEYRHQLMKRGHRVAMIKTT